MKYEVGVLESKRKAYYSKCSIFRNSDNLFLLIQYIFRRAHLEESTNVGFESVKHTLKLTSSFVYILYTGFIADQLV